MGPLCAKEAKRSKAAVPPQPAPARRPVPVACGKRRAVEAVAGGSGASDAAPRREGQC
jgi:hypothetical protein